MNFFITPVSNETCLVYYPCFFLQLGVYLELYLDTVIRFILRILSKEYRKLELRGSHLDNCPPEDAEPASGTVYYLVRNNPPQEEDFIPGIEKHPSIYGRRPKDQICQAHGFSVFTDIEDALKTKRRRNGLKDTEPAVGELTPECGVIKSTPSRTCYSHHTWWPPNDMEIWSLFQIVT